MNRENTLVNTRSLNTTLTTVLVVTWAVPAVWVRWHAVPIIMQNLAFLEHGKMESRAGVSNEGGDSQ